MHALHVFERQRQDALLAQMADALAPGGVLALVGFSVNEWLPQTLWRVAGEHGFRAAVDLVRWRVADAFAALIFGGSGDRRAPEDLRGAMQAAGLEVGPPERVFVGCSTLLIGRKG